MIVKCCIVQIFLFALLYKTLITCYRFAHLLRLFSRFQIFSNLIYSRLWKLLLVNLLLHVWLFCNISDWIWFTGLSYLQWIQLKQIESSKLVFPLSLLKSILHVYNRNGFQFIIMSVKCRMTKCLRRIVVGVFRFKTKLIDSFPHAFTELFMIFFKKNRWNWHIILVR
jgi:hypothetical protein